MLSTYGQNEKNNDSKENSLKTSISLMCDKSFKYTKIIQNLFLKWTSS